MMFKSRVFVSIFLLVVVSACTVNNNNHQQELPTSLPVVTVTTEPIIPSPTTLVMAPIPSPFVAYPTATPTLFPPSADLSIVPEQVIVYPVDKIFSGDKVTFQVWASVPDVLSPSQVDVQIEVDGKPLVNGSLSYRILGGDTIGTVGLFPWVWDTQEMSGEHWITISLDPENKLKVGDEDPENNVVNIPIMVKPQTEMPAAIATEAWLTQENSCCYLHFISNSAAHRDLQSLLTMVDEAVNQASRQLQEVPEDKLHIYFIDRVIGQGGYATGNLMVISYLDRQYVGASVYEILVHEAVHAIDTQFAPNRIGFLAEGVAVWATGGHYKQESLQARNAVLVETGRYIPLDVLIDNFILTQHEIGYLEAGGFVEYLVETYGWERTKAFYMDAEQSNAGSLSEVVDGSLQKHFKLSLSEIEGAWLSTFQKARPNNQIVEDVKTTIRYYDSMRDYQQTYDLSAYFLTAWLPSPQDIQERKITADLSRHPSAEMNVTLEIMLKDAHQALQTGNYNRANVILDSLERILTYQAFIDPLSNNYRQIVHLLMLNGYEVQKVNLQGNYAVAQVTHPYLPNLTQVDLVLKQQSWAIVP